jgi:hypothetical protein
VYELSRAHDYSVAYLLHFQVVFLGVSKGFEKNIGTRCDSFLPSLDISLSCTRAPLMVVCVAETYRMSG